MPHFDYDHKITKNVFDTRKERKGVQSQDTSMYPSENEQEDLRDFLSKKIKEIKDKINPDEDVYELARISDGVHKSRYKVNHMNAIQSVRINGAAKGLEDKFNSRVTRTGVDFNFKNALLSQDKKATKQLASTMHKFNEVYQQMLSNKTAYHTQESMNSQGNAT